MLQLFSQRQDPIDGVYGAASEGNRELKVHAATAGAALANGVALATRTIQGGYDKNAAPGEREAGAGNMSDERFSSCVIGLVGSTSLFPASPLSVQLTLGIILTMLGGWISLSVFFRGRYPRILQHELSRAPTTPEAYSTHGLGPLASNADGRSLYLDLMKRAVSNILYEDPPLGYYDNCKQPQQSRGFDLARRVAGEEIHPTQAHTMIGIRRLDHLQESIERVLAEDIPGDFVEAGVFRGGAAVFMRAMLKAHQVTDRRVVGCDTFVSTDKQQDWLQSATMPVVQGLAALPGKSWARWLFMQAQHLNQSFPSCNNPSDDLIRVTMWLVRNQPGTCLQSGTSLNDVKSHFARYGLLDNQVQLLPGFFADTLADDAISQVAVLRLDGDTYESTMDVLKLLYPKLSRGGFCIIDNYHAFPDCARAVNDYLQHNKSQVSLTEIDRLAVCWRKP